VVVMAEGGIFVELIKRCGISFTLRQKREQSEKHERGFYFDMYCLELCDLFIHIPSI